MEKSPKQLKEIKASDSLPAVKAARSVHPEELSIGNFVALSSFTFQYPSYLWCGISPLVSPPDEAISVQYRPFEPEPLQVKAICLPYIVCELVDGKASVYDLRLVRLVKLDDEFAKIARKALIGNSKPEKKRKRKKGRKSKSKNA